MGWLSQPSGAVAAAQGIGVLSITAKNGYRRAVDVNPPVTVRNHAAIAAAGADEGGANCPIDSLSIESRVRRAIIFTNN
ncbi:MAG UNVERIFIED_CONTAM: hypothetical protein LVR18_26965 [Planctomycetaceae bacterium]|jgi:hypothetical protein